MQGLPLPVSIYEYKWNAEFSRFDTTVSGRTDEARIRWMAVDVLNHRFMAREPGKYLLVVQAATGATVPTRKNVKIEIISPSVSISPPVVEAKNVPFVQPKYTGTITQEPFYEGEQGQFGPFYNYIHNVSSEPIARVWSPYGHISGQWYIELGASGICAFQVLDSFLGARIDCMAIVFRLHPLEQEYVEDANLLRLAISGNPQTVGGVTVNRISSSAANRRRWRVTSTTGGKIVWSFTSTHYKVEFAHELRARCYQISGPSSCRIRAYNSATLLSSDNLTISDPAATETVRSYLAGAPTITSLEVDNIAAGVTFDLEARLNVIS